MSHRVTNKTEVKNKAILSQVLKDQGFSYDESGDTFTITSGPLHRTVINTATGEITGDTDYGASKRAYENFALAYGEAAFRQDCLMKGATIESRRVNAEGEPVLVSMMQA